MANEATRTVWGDATPLPAAPPPIIVRRPAWTRVGPALAFSALGAALIAFGVADTPAVVAAAVICIVGGLVVAALHLAVPICSGCRRPIDWRSGTVVVPIERAEELRSAVAEGDTHRLVFSLTGVPAGSQGPHATIDVTFCKCHGCGTLGASTHPQGPGGPTERLVAPFEIASVHLGTLAELSAL